MKKSNRDRLNEYFAKVKVEDNAKVKMFCDACFTEANLALLDSCTKTDFKQAGEEIGKAIVTTMSKIRDERLKKSAPKKQVSNQFSTVSDTPQKVSPQPVNQQN